MIKSKRGKISQEINILLELGIIEKVDVSETGQITYQMKSVILAFLQVSFNALSEYIKWKVKLESIKFELEKQKENLKPKYRMENPLLRKEYATYY